MKTIICLFSMVFGLCFSSSLAFADDFANGFQITPSFVDYGSFPDATFGGTGIPTDLVVYTHYPNGMTLAISATQRYDNPPTTSPSAGTFHAEAGVDPNHAGYAKWNFDFYASNLPEGSTARLYYDVDPYVNNVTTNFIDLGSAPLIQNSWNLGMGFLGGNKGFDPTVDGDYGFAIGQLTKDGVLWDYTAIRVVVGNGGKFYPTNNVPDGGNTLLFLSAGFVGMVGLTRFRRTTKHIQRVSV